MLLIQFLKFSQKYNQLLARASLFLLGLSFCIMVIQTYASCVQYLIGIKCAFRTQYENLFKANKNI